MSALNGTAPPSNVEAEESVLGACLLAGTVTAAVEATGLRAADFYHAKHGTIYTACLELRARGASIDRLSLCAQLSGRLERVGGREVIDRLDERVPVVGNAPEYARIVLDCARQRRERDALHRYEEHPGDADARQVLAALLGDPSEQATHPGIRWLDADELLDTTPPDVPWLLKPLIARGALTLLCGQSGVGKSLLALAAASAVAHGTQTLAGMPVNAGTVALLDAENGPRLLHQRAHLVDLAHPSPSEHELVPARGRFLEDAGAGRNEPRGGLLVRARGLREGREQLDHGVVGDGLHPRNLGGHGAIGQRAGAAARLLTGPLVLPRLPAPPRRAG